MWYGNFRMPECIMINANALSADEAPREWDDLVAPEWKGRIVLRDPSKSGTMRAIFGAMVWRTYKDSGDTTAGVEWLRRLHDNVETYAPDPRAMYQALNTAETPVTVWNMVDAHIQSQQGYNFMALLPASGVPVLIEGIAITAGAPHRAEAELFYEWVTTAEQLAWQAHEFHRIPARRDISGESLPAWMTEQEIVAMEIDAERYAPLEGEWMERFRREIQTR
jgi:iron(III) transport system substrate-binding protein